MSAIGGYFSLELAEGEHYHKGALRLNTARNCLEYVLIARKYKKIFIPYYTCEVVLEPIKRLRLNYEFYSIDEKLDPVFDYTSVGIDDVFLYTNYYGLKQKTVEILSQICKNLVIDNSQAFYAPPITGVDTFYSARKFFGVADGAYLYTDCYLNKELEQDFSYERMSHLLKRSDINAESGYPDFKKNDDSLNNNPIRKMSKLTEALLCSVNYEEIKRKRRENFLLLDRHLKTTNLFSFDLYDNDVPMVYPYHIKDGELKRELIQNQIYIATYWPNVIEWCNEQQWEYILAQNSTMLPVDQRYGRKEMKSIIKKINHG